jgi:indole-3-glycerol phosphate synthase
VSSVLERILAAKRAEVEQQKKAVASEPLMERAASTPPPRSLVQALRQRRPAIIAEIKRASPSRGPIRPELDCAALARQYAQAGAAAVSVLTDRHFEGSLADLEAARAVVNLPLLRKDFIFDPYQLYQARAHGADAVLLIAAMLKPAHLADLYRQAGDLGLSAVVEVHSQTEFEQALKVGPEVVGINSRDLHTFAVDMTLTERLLGGYRGSALIIAESGIESAADLRRLARAGAGAFLVGESLLRGDAPAARLAELIAEFARLEEGKANQAQ